jgi:hypothetical protein
MNFWLSGPIAAVVGSMKLKKKNAEPAQKTPAPMWTIRSAICSQSRRHLPRMSRGEYMERYQVDVSC